MAPSVGIFDSGVGGLTVVRAVREVIPERGIVYLGDTARVPYGTKSARTVERYSLACLGFLLDHQVDLILVACNTASASALPALRRHSAVPVIGAVEPGARSSVTATRNGHIGVIGTLATIASGAYERAILGLDPSFQVTSMACPLLVPLAEEGWTDDDIAQAVAQRYLSALFERDPRIDTLVLGCTHYPLLSEMLRRTARELTQRDVATVDSATAMAAVARATLEQQAEGGLSERGRLSCYATDISRLSELGPRFLGEPLHSFDLVDL